MTLVTNGGIVISRFDINTLLGQTCRDTMAAVPAIPSVSFLF